MKKIFGLMLLSLLTSTFAGTPAQDRVIAKYQKAFRDSKGGIWDMVKDDGVYFQCNLFSARKGSAERYTFTFKVENDGDLFLMDTILFNGRFSGVPLFTDKVEVTGVNGIGDSAEPLELIAIRVGAPISMEKPMIDRWENDGVPTRIMSRPLYLEVSQIQEGIDVGYTTKPLSPEARKNPKFRVKEYGVCFLSKKNSRLNNSGRGFAGNTRSAWDGASIWTGKPSREIGY